MSTHVSTLGLREQRTASINLQASAEQVPVYESKVDPDLANHGTLGIPYVSVVASTDRTLVGIASIERPEAGYVVGTEVYATVSGARSPFIVRQAEGDSVELYRRYRTGGGYAAQTLQAIAVPVDVGITVVGAAAATVGVVLLPVGYGVKLIRESNDGDGKARPN